MTQTPYLLASSRGELERLQVQARVWEPDAYALFKEIGVRAGAVCADIGCGAMGVLRPLSEAAGDEGRVVGTEVDERLLDAAEQFVDEASLRNVLLCNDDIFASALDANTFDFVHARFLFAPLGSTHELLDALLRVLRPGGTLVVQEPDSTSWSCLPPHKPWERLTAYVIDAYARNGGDFNAGRSGATALRRAGLEDVRVRASVHTLPGGHPYMRLPIQLADSLRPRILKAGVDARELDTLIAEVETIAADRRQTSLTFTLVQTWGRKTIR